MDSVIRNTNRAETEVVVVDSVSDDGQIGILKEYERNGLIRLIVRKCNRGEGRQIAYLESRGTYIISGVDTDDQVGPGLRELLSEYHSKYEGSVLKAVGVTIAPRAAVEAIGGWRPLYASEDYDFWNRAREAGLLRETGSDPFAVRVRRHHSVSYTIRLLWRYARQGRTPVLSWKWEPAWALIRVVSFLAGKVKGREEPKTPSVPEKH